MSTKNNNEKAAEERVSIFNKLPFETICVAAVAAVVVVVSVISVLK